MDVTSAVDPAALAAFRAHRAAGEDILPGSDDAELMHVAARRAQWFAAEMNGAHRTADELRALFAELVGLDEPPADLSIFPPFTTDFGLNLTVGSGVFFNSGVRLQDQGGIRIGDRVLVGHNVVMATLDHDLAPERRSLLHAAPIAIEDDVWIGSNATITKGVTVGRGSVVAAGAVVTRDVPPMTVVGGVPARVLRAIEPAGASA